MFPPGCFPPDVLRNIKIYVTISAGADVPVRIAEAIVQISTSKTAVAAIVQITERLPQQGQTAQGSTVHPLIRGYRPSYTPAYAGVNSPRLPPEPHARAPMPQPATPRPPPKRAQAKPPTPPRLKRPNASHSRQPEVVSVPFR